MTAVKKIAILTSGGDAPGMNACLRGIVRTALNKGWEVHGIRDAYQGLVAGADSIFPLDWGDVSWNFREGGTFLGSARYTDLVGDSDLAKDLKQKALLNLKRQGISSIIVIGGDGSLTGAYNLFAFLKQHGSENTELHGMELSIVGIPGSIDNDIACTDMSIGADTTLNTIVECIDRLRDTATSHKRINIVEVMGRLRGYLAVMSGLATGADRIFIREEKITRDKLNAMLNDLAASFAHGQKAGVIVRSEGAFFPRTSSKKP
jgi:6-phosphofructokinase 1